MVYLAFVLTLKTRNEKLFDYNKLNKKGRLVGEEKKKRKIMTYLVDPCFLST